MRHLFVLAVFLALTGCAGLSQRLHDAGLDLAVEPWER